MQIFLARLVATYETRVEQTSTYEYPFRTKHIQRIHDRVNKPSAPKVVFEAAKTKAIKVQLRLR